MEDFYAAKDVQYYARARTDVLDLLHPGVISLLDVGCGTGATAAVARDRGVQRTVGVELFEEAAAQARPHFDVLLVGDVETVVADLPDERFDAILCADVLEHLKDPWTVLKTLHAHLAPGGHLVASLPNLQYYRVLAKIMLDRFEYEPAGILDRTHLRFFTLHTIRRMFEDCGYRIERVVEKRSYSRLGKTLGLVSFGRLHKFLTVQYLVVARPN